MMDLGTPLASELEREAEYGAEVALDTDLRKLHGYGQTSKALQRIKRTIHRAVMAEREACAQLARETNRDAWSPRNDAIAHAIMERPAP